MNVYREYVIPESDDIERLLKTKMTRLAHLLYTFAPQDGVLDLPISGLSIVRYSGTEIDCPKTFLFTFFKYCCPRSKVYLNRSRDIQA